MSDQLTTTLPEEFVEQEPALCANEATELMTTYAETGDVEAFTKLVLLAGTHGLRLLTHVGVQGDSEDILQEVWIKVMRKRHLFTKGRAFQPWFNRIVVNTAYDYLRSRKRHVPPFLFSQVDNEEHGSMFDYTIELHHPCADVPLLMGIQDALTSLPLIYKQVLVDVDLMGSSTEEVATTIDRAPATVRWRRHEGLRMMRELLSDDY